MKETTATNKSGLMCVSSMMFWSDLTNPVDWKRVLNYGECRGRMSLWQGKLVVEDFIY